MANVYFLDTNIFMYAAGASHPYKEPCVRILSLVETGELVAAINTEVLQELLYRYSHISLPDKGVQLCRMILKYPLLIWPVTETDIRLAIDLFHAHYARGLKVHDAIHREPGLLEMSHEEARRCFHAHLDAHAEALVSEHQYLQRQIERCFGVEVSLGALVVANAGKRDFEILLASTVLVPIFEPTPQEVDEAERLLEQLRSIGRGWYR